ncbi:MAG: ADP-ribosylglycohydrolase family protein [Desulfuromonadaceae bacterium]|nr:ADP-ribosylglycohydrolase family protein [Desulfuromonadaceae bacterium]
MITQGNHLETRRRRNALWGLFIGDTLAMPAHWIYTLDKIAELFPGGIQDFRDPPHPHPESFMFKMSYEPDTASAARLGRPFDILHRHARFLRSNYDPPGPPPSGRKFEHGLFAPSSEERYHYHHGLRKGDNTVNAHLVRVLMRAVIRAGRYDPGMFLDDFITHLTTPGKNADPYTEIYLRRWFENYSKGLPPQLCAASQREIWSIGSHGGLIRPLVLATLATGSYQGLGLAVEHQHLTHRSENVAAALGVLVPLLLALVDGEDPAAAIPRFARSLRLPRTTGKRLSRLYWEYNGPNNIPAEEMWELHTSLEEEPFDLESLAREKKDAEVIRGLLSTACYPEHGVPLLLYFACRHDFDLRKALLANVNAGGDNVHRGMILGLLLGAVAAEIPADLRQGLTDHQELEKEINAFTETILQGTG